MISYTFSCCLSSKTSISGVLLLLPALDVDLLGELPLDLDLLLVLDVDLLGERPLDLDRLLDLDRSLDLDRLDLSEITLENLGVEGDSMSAPQT